MSEIIREFDEMFEKARKHKAYTEEMESEIEQAEQHVKMITPRGCPISGKCAACIDYDVDFSECSRDGMRKEQTDTCKHFEVEPDIQLNS